MVYIPLGVGAAIPPWNFPAAIATGMTVAALVTGNTVVLKPSEEATVVASKMVEILYEAGIPKGALNLVTGAGEIVGDALVKNPKTRFITFTGSKEVGLHIIRQRGGRGRRRPGQIWIKRTVLEMGGKDWRRSSMKKPISIPPSKESRRRRLGYQGQKCSACSRAIVSGKRFTTRSCRRWLSARRKSRSGRAKIQRTTWVPLRARPRLRRCSAISTLARRRDACLWVAIARRVTDRFVQATVIADVDPRGAHCAGRNFRAGARQSSGAHAISIMRSKLLTAREFGLKPVASTSKNLEKLEKAREAFHVGNLYLNRKCTGAMVGARTRSADSICQRGRIPEDWADPTITHAVPAGQEHR